MWTRKNAKHLWFLVLLGCGERVARRVEPAQPPVLPVRDELHLPALSGESVESFDLDGDGRVDAFSYFLEKHFDGGPVQRRLTRREFDLDGDGRVDLQRTFGARGEPDEERLDFDFDGRADAMNRYEGGRLKEKRFDADADGRFDFVHHYEGGRLTRKEEVGP